MNQKFLLLKSSEFDELKLLTYKISGIPVRIARCSDVFKEIQHFRCFTKISNLNKNKVKALEGIHFFRKREVWENLAKEILDFNQPY